MRLLNPLSVQDGLGPISSIVDTGPYAWSTMSSSSMDEAVRVRN